MDHMISLRQEVRALEAELETETEVLRELWDLATVCQGLLEKVRPGDEALKRVEAIDRSEITDAKELLLRVIKAIDNPSQ